MSYIESSLGKKSFTGTQQRVLNVPNEEGFQEEMPKRLSDEEAFKIKEARQEAIENKKKVSYSAKERIEYLLNLGRASKEVEINGLNFSLQTLKAVETKDTIKKAGEEATQGEASFMIRNVTLAYSLCKIDGQAVSLVIGDDSFEGKLDLIEKMDEEVIQYLYENYRAMVEEHKKKFIIETKEEMKEVAEDIKK